MKLVSLDNMLGIMVKILSSHVEKLLNRAQLTSITPLIPYLISPESQLAPAHSSMALLL